MKYRSSPVHEFTQHNNNLIEQVQLILCQFCISTIVTFGVTTTKHFNSRIKGIIHGNLTKTGVRHLSITQSTTFQPICDFSNGDDHTGAQNRHQQTVGSRFDLWRFWSTTAIKCQQIPMNSQQSCVYFQTVARVIFPIISAKIMHILFFITHDFELKRRS